MVSLSSGWATTTNKLLGPDRTSVPRAQRWIARLGINRESTTFWSLTDTLPTELSPLLNTWFWTRLKRGLKEKSMGVSKVDSILLEPAVLKIFYFKHDVRASNAIIFIGNLDVDSFSVVSDAIPVLTWRNVAIRLLHWVVSQRTNQLDLVSKTDPSWKKE